MGEGIHVPAEAPWNGPPRPGGSNRACNAFGMPNLPYLFRFRAARMRHMRMKLGDKVQSIGGVEGEIVSRSTEPRSVMVKVAGVWRGSGIVSIPLARLKFISGYSVVEFPPLFWPPSNTLSILRRPRRPRAAPF